MIKHSSAVFLRVAVLYGAMGLVGLTAVSQLWEFPYPRLVYGQMAFVAFTGGTAMLVTHWVLDLWCSEAETRDPSLYLDVWASVFLVFNVLVTFWIIWASFTVDMTLCLREDAPICVQRSPVDPKLLPPPSLIPLQIILGDG